MEGCAPSPASLALVLLVAPHEHDAKLDVADLIAVGAVEELGDGEPLLWAHDCKQRHSDTCPNLEVERLASIDDVEAAAELVLGEAVVGRGEVTGGVQGGAVLTLNEARLLEADRGEIDDGGACAR